MGHATPCRDLSGTTQITGTSLFIEGLYTFKVSTLDAMLGMIAKRHTLSAKKKRFIGLYFMFLLFVRHNVYSSQSLYGVGS